MACHSSALDVSSAFLQGVQLPKARLLRANFTNADVRNSNLESADLSYASLNGANFRLSNLQHVSLVSADLSDGDFAAPASAEPIFRKPSSMQRTWATPTSSAIKWQQIKSVKKTNLAGVKMPPKDFCPGHCVMARCNWSRNPNCPVAATGP